MLQLNHLLTENAVLQAGKPHYVSGKTEPNCSIKLLFGNGKFEETSDSEGSFLFKVPAQPYNLETTLRIVSNNECIEIFVRYGDVFLFGGQSNMDFRMENEDHFLEEQQELAEEGLFFNNVPQVDYDDGKKQLPETIVEHSWQKLTKDNLKEMSAIAYYATKEHRRKFPDRMIGVVNCSKGGTSASCWISEEYLVKSPAITQDILSPYKEAIKGKEDETLKTELAHYWKQSEEFYKNREKIMREQPNLTLREFKEQFGHSPWPPPANPYLFTRPSGLYQQMFKNIVPYTFSSVIWYQGEEDTENSHLYYELLHLLIKQWRKDLKEELPFYIVQLPVCEDRPGHDWPTVRQTQQQVAQEIDQGYLITSLDCGEIDDIHPTEKTVLGQRIGEIIEGFHYKNCPTASLRSWTKNEVIIEIRETQVIRSTDLHAIQGDQEINSITIDRNRLIICSESQLTNIYYAWNNASEVTLYNEIGYPVSPFYFEKENENRQNESI